MQDKITPYLPIKGVIAKYLEATDGAEICPRFRYFSFLAAVGSLFGRRVFLRRSSNLAMPAVFPNPWIVLIAPPAQGHKSTSLRVALRTIQELEPKLRPRIIATKITPEALTKTLSAASITTQDGCVVARPDATGLVYSPEFGVLLGKEKYLTGMIPLLCDLYDCPDEWTSETIGRGVTTLRNVCLTVMAASTPAWLQDIIPEDAFTGGFMSRILVVTLPPTWNVKVPEPPDTPEQLKQEITHELTKLAQLQGEVRLSAEAQELFHHWYLNRPSPATDFEALYLERKQDHLLKAALIQALCEGYKEIPAEILQRTLDQFAALEEDSLPVINELAVQPRARPIYRLAHYMKISGRKEFTQQELLSAVWQSFQRPVSDFGEALRLLVSLGCIDYGTDGTVKFLKPLSIHQIKEDNR